MLPPAGAASGRGGAMAALNSPPSGDHGLLAADISHLNRRRFLRMATGLSLTTLAGAPFLDACAGAAPGSREEPAARVYRLGWLVDGPPYSGSSVVPIIPAGSPRQRLVDRLAE